MEYINYLRSGIYVLIDKSSDFLSNRLPSYNNTNISNNNIKISNNNTNISDNIDILNNTNKKCNKKRLFDQVPILDQINTFFSKPTHIIDNIYVGSAFNASHYNTLQDLDIGLIINITSEISNQYPDKIKYKKYPLYDNNKQSIKTHLENAYKNIIKYQSNNIDKNILVHCFMGASRSVSVIIYYLMCKHNYSVHDAIIFIKKKREIINPTLLFYNELSEIEQRKL